MALARTALGDVVAAVAARSPTPGGGAAAAITGALAAASGAMAARYTTGAKWADREAEAQRLAAQLDDFAQQFMALADADGAAFAALQATPKGTPQRQLAERAAAAIATDILALCSDALAALSRFRAQCNPNLLSDVLVGMHLLSGAAQAAVATARAGAHPDETRIGELLARIATAAP